MSVDGGMERTAASPAAQNDGQKRSRPPDGEFRRRRRTHAGDGVVLVVLGEDLDVDEPDVDVSDVDVASADRERDDDSLLESCR